ncbi:MAG: ATP-binding protein [Candidatus Peribacteraceae bacterium]|nr:ATP-binding protein [Candidatus Peribacteraceae bacterium]
MMQAAPRTPAAHSIRKRSLRASLFLEVFILLIISVAAVTITAFILASQELRSRTVTQISAATQSRALLLENTIAKQREQISILAQDPRLATLPSVTRLVGFKKLLEIDPQGNTKIIAEAQDGGQVGSATLSAIEPETSMFHPVISEQGWTSYVIAAPKNDESGRQGMMVAIFDAEPLIAQILRVDYLGETAEVLLTTTVNGERILLRGNNHTLSPLVLRVPWEMGNVTGQSQGMYEGTDYAGVEVIGAYRHILSIGWSVVVKIDRFEVVGPPMRIAMNLASAGLFLVGFLSLSMYFLSKKIVGPLEELTVKFEGLETKRWKFGRSIFTGNELEAVDTAGADLAERFRHAHDHLESIVQERTEELRSQHAEDAAIMQSMEDGLVVTDAHGIISYANNAAAMLTGCTAEDLHGRKATDMFRLVTKEDQTLDESTHPITTVLHAKKSWRPRIDPEITLVRKDGKNVPLQLRVTPILSEQRCIGSVALIRDMTEERRIDRMKSEFITLVSHQLRTPLSSMRWYLEMLLGGEAGALKGDQETYVKEVDAANSRMVQLVNALLEVSKIELGTFTLHPTPIDLRKLTDEVLKTLRAMQSNRHVSVECSSPDIPLLVASDTSLLTLIIENLISNAIKYSGGGSPVQINIDRTADGQYAILTVRDRGIGIPSAQQRFIGKKLFRGTNAMSLDTDGNGLGLYISSIAAETIGANISFDSTEAEETTFSLKIPLLRQSGVSASPDIPSSPARSTIPGERNGKK